MKRSDAFRKLHTICQRLDELTPSAFRIKPRRLYLYGSVLTDKPDPNDINLLLVHEYTADFNYEKMVSDMAYGRPVPDDRIVLYLRTGMKMVQVALIRSSLKNWQQSHLFLVIRPRLIWQPGAKWAAILDEIEAWPLPWGGPRAEEIREQIESYMANLSGEKLETHLAQALAEIESQEVSFKEPSTDNFQHPGRDRPQRPGSME